MICLIAQGGIGNQLFYWNYAHELNKKYGSKVCIVFSKNQVPEREVCLSNISHYCTHGISVKFSVKLHFILKSLDILRLRMPRLVGKYENVFGIVSIPIPGDLLENLEPKIKVMRGYFQNSASVMNNYNLYRSEINAWLENNVSISVKHLILENPNFTALHVRRGDFEFSKDSTGILSNEYFLNLLDREMPVIIATDDIFAVSDLEESFPNALVLDPRNIAPIESLYILTKAKKLITSNSTFSWWAAVIGKSDIEEIIMPRPWNIRQINEANYLKLPDVTYSEAIFQK